MPAHAPPSYVSPRLFLLCAVSAVRSIVLFIRAHLADPTLHFHLYTAPPKTVLRGAKQTLLQAGLVPATVLYVGLEEPSATGVLTCVHTAAVV